MIRTAEHLDSDAAADEAAALLTRAFDAARTAHPQHVTLKACGEAVGYGGEDAGNPFRECLKGTRPLTLAKLLQLCAHKPSVGQHVVAGFAGWFAARVLAGAASRDRIAALDELLRAVLALAAELVAARADNTVDDDEARRLREPMARVRTALERFEATLACPCSAPSGRAVQ